MMRKTYTFIFVCVWMVGCSGPTKGGNDAAQETAAASEQTASMNTQPTAVNQLDARTAQMWANSCALCHVDGNAGAPRLGNSEEWQPRLAQGEAVLLKHTVEGLNDMPPLGYCMACEDEHFVAMIRFMSGGNLTGDTP